MRVTLSSLVVLCALLLAAGEASAAPQSISLKRLSGEVSGSIGVAQAGVTVDVALERNHRGTGGVLLEHVAIAAASTTTDAAGAWSLELVRPWGGDPRDAIAVHYTGAPADVGNVDIAALAEDGTPAAALTPSTIGWSADGTAMNVDCGDTDAGVGGACAAVSAEVAGRAGSIAGALDGSSTRLWQLALGAPLGLDDHVLVTEERTVSDAAGHPARVLITRDAGMPRGGDPTVQRVAGLAPRCALALPNGDIRCHDLDARGAYTANGTALSYETTSATFIGRVAGVTSGSIVDVRRVGAASGLALLHVAPRYNGTCAPGQWLGIVRVRSDVARTRICPPTGRMAGVDSADTEVDELSGGWTAGDSAASPAPSTSSEVLNLTSGAPRCKADCIVTVRSRRVNAVLRIRKGGSTGMAVVIARVGRRTLRSLARGIVVDERIELIEGQPVSFVGENHITAVGADGLRLELTSSDGYELTAAGATTKASAAITVRRTRAGDPGVIDAVRGLAKTLKRKGRGSLRLDAPLAEKTTILFRRGSRVLAQRSVRLSQSLGKTITVRRPKGATSIVVATADALGAKTRVVARV